MKKKSVLFTVILTLIVVLAMGCNSSLENAPPPKALVGEESPEVSENLTTPSVEEAQEVHEIKPKPPKPLKEKEYITPKRLSFVSEGGTFPDFPSSAKELNGFLPPHFIIRDQVELDYNGDGLTDYVLVIDALKELKDQGKEEDIFYSRLLAIVSQNAKGEFQLDYADSWTVPATDEGGVWGDPYESMTTSGKNSFTINAFGGSAFKWGYSETYEYMDGLWYIVLYKAENYDRNSETESSHLEDYKTGIGNIQALESGGEIYTGRGVDFTYQLETPLTITEYSQRREGWINHKEVPLNLEHITIPEKHSITKEEIMVAYRENSVTVLAVRNEYHALQFQINDLGFVALYNADKKTANFLEDSNIKDIGFFDDRFYYMVYEFKIVYLDNGDESREVISISLYSTNLDGTDKRLSYSSFAYDTTQSLDMLNKTSDFVSIDLFVINIGNNEILLYERPSKNDFAYHIIDSYGNPLRGIPWEIVNPVVAEEWDKRVEEFGGK